jgi:hypothetical protein
MNEAYIFKIKENKLDTWKNWELELMKRKSEALETIIEEGEIFEGSFIFEIKGDWYVMLYGYNEEELLPATDKEINNKHKLIKKECLERVTTAHSGYFLFDKNFNLK